MKHKQPERMVTGGGGSLRIRSATLLLIFASVFVNSFFRPFFAVETAVETVETNGSVAQAETASAASSSSRPRPSDDDAATTKKRETRVQTEPVPRRTDNVTSPPHVDPASVVVPTTGVVDVLPDDPRCKLVLDPNSRSASAELARLESGEFRGGSTNGVGKPDGFALGPCRYYYPQRVRPPKGYTADFDWFNFRTESPEVERREGCFVRCLELMERMEEREFEFGQEMLTAAAFMGLTEASRVLMERHGLDPTKGDEGGQRRRALGDDRAPDSEGVLLSAAGGVPDAGPRKKLRMRRGDLSNSTNTNIEDYRLNAMQAALMGGYVDVVKVLSGGDYSTIIDGHNRTVEDYVRLRGSPVRPYYARTVLGIDVEDDDRHVVTSEERKLNSKYPEDGWNDTMARPDVDYSCDFDVVDADAVDLDRELFLRDYYVTGRPVVLRNAVSKEEMSTFTKSAWENLRHFHPTNRHKVGVTAYPNLSMQERCSHDMSAEEVERDERCADTPDLHMMHAEHSRHFDEAYGMHGGDPTMPGGGFSRLVDYFPGVGHGWQIFFGSDMSGATLHWHAAAFNVLYVGTKEWHVTPPLYRGFTGMPAEVALERFASQPFGMRCTQRPGDLIYIPDHWGHLTLNHGFGIGVASIVKQSPRGVPGAVARGD